MKRMILAMVLTVGTGLFVPANAACTGSSIATGMYDTTNVTIGTLKIHVEGYTTTFTPNSAQVCSDGTAGQILNAHLTMTVGESLVCDRADYPLEADPFTFGDAHRNMKPNPAFDDKKPEDATNPRKIPDGPCGVDMSWSNLFPTFGLAPSVIDGIAMDKDNVHAGVNKYVPVGGRYWYGGGAPVFVGPGTLGTYTRGVGASCQVKPDEASPQKGCFDFD